MTIDDGRDAQLASMAALVESGLPPTEAEWRVLRDGLGDERKLIQRRAAETLAALAARGIAVHGVMDAALAAPDWRSRWGATYALALIGRVSEAALVVVLEALGHDDSDLRWAAAHAITAFAALDRPLVLRRLLEVADGGAPVQRRMTLYCLRDLGAPEGAPAAVRALADEQVDVRLAALAALARLGRSSADAARRIAALVDDPNPRIQRAAAAGLGAVGIANADVLSVLRRAEHSADASLRRAAARSLRMVGAFPPLPADPAGRGSG